VQSVSNWLPFQWSFQFPIEVAIGRLSNVEILQGIGMQLALDRRHGVRVLLGLAPGGPELHGGRGMRQIGPVRLAMVHLKVAALNEFQYRLNFFVQLLQSRSRWRSD
jgi:hypothetical protein